MGKVAATKVSDEIYEAIKTKGEISSFVREAIEEKLKGNPGSDSEELQNRIMELESQLQDQEEQINELLNRSPQPLNPYNEQQLSVLNLVIEKIAQKTGKRYDPFELLYRIFYMQLTEGTGDWLPFTISKNRLQQ